jgi:hypothetical protein
MVTEDRGARPRLPICVVIPAYNRASVLPRCLASVWAQRPALPAEVIVIDDNSSDDTAEVARALGARVLRQPTNQGTWAARNAGIRATACEWVAFLDSDDEWLPDHLAHLWELRDGHALAGTSSLHQGAGSHQFHGPVARRPIVLNSPDLLIGTFNLFTASASMIARDVALAVGGFENWWGVADFDLWVRVLERHSAICSPRVTVIYHVHEQQLSLHKERMLEEHRAVAEAHHARTGASPAALERWEAVVAWDAMQAELAGGRLRPALRAARSALGGRERIAGVATQLRWRLAVRRRSAALGPNGRATRSPRCPGPFPHFDSAGAARARTAARRSRDRCLASPRAARPDRGHPGGYERSLPMSQTDEPTRTTTESACATSGPAAARRLSRAGRGGRFHAGTRRCSATCRARHERLTGRGRFGPPGLGRTRHSPGQEAPNRSG